MGVTREVFATVTITNNIEATIYEGYGLDFFTAMSKSKGDITSLIIELMTRLIEVEGKFITHDYIYSMPMKDVSYLNEIISQMMSNQYSKGI